MTTETNSRVRGYDRAKPTPGNQGEYIPERSSRYGDIYQQPLPGERHALALEGSYFYFHNVTNDAATTLAGHPAPVLADADATMTKPLIFMRMPAGATKFCFLDFIEIEVVTAGAAGTAANWAAQLDTGATRYSSGTVETATVVNPNMQSTETADLVTLLGPVVVGAESANVRHLGHGQIRAAIEFAGDRTLFKFGGQPDVGANVVAGAASRHTVYLPPVILGATDQFLLALYAPSQSGAGVYKVKGGFWAR